MNDNDTPWKRAVETLFPEFLQFCWPTAYALVDWTVAPIFLEQELLPPFRQSRAGRRRVDKVVQVATRVGAYVILHAEIQHHRDPDFAERMHIYHRSLCHAHRYPVHCLAILADDSNTWRPDIFVLPLLDGANILHFPILKIIDFSERIDELLSSDNAFARFVAAHLLARQTRRNPSKRLELKVMLVCGLYSQRYWSDQVFADLISLIDWLLELPAELQQQFDDQMKIIERRHNMDLMPRFAHKAMKEGRRIGFDLGREEGRQEGMREGMSEGKLLGQRELLGQLLAARFGTLPANAMLALRNATEAELKQWGQALCDARSLDEVFG